MIRLFSRSLVVTVLSLLASETVADEPQPRELFDGRSLQGWEYDKRHWRVEDGAIVGEIPAGQTLGKNTWIVWRGGELADFDLRLQVKLTGAPAANSGIQFRCQVTDVDHVSGYQADLDQGATWLGRIYDEHGRALLVERGQRVRIDAQGKRTSKVLAPAGQYGVLFRENDWNDYRIVAIGERMAVYINGTLFADLVDQQVGERDLKGRLAFQLHSGPETRVEFREIRLEELQPDDARLGNFIINTPDADDREAPGIRPRSPDGKLLNLDFETGDLAGWTATGDAFRGQPVSEDGIAQRWPQQQSNKSGRFFIGGYEIVADRGQGTLTSPVFQIVHPYASFLIAGGDQRETRVELICPAGDEREEVVVSAASGNRREQMRRVVVDLRERLGQQLAIRLVDESSGAWGHLNFDDFRFHESRPEFADELHRGINNPLLQHLVPNRVPAAGPATSTLADMHVPAGFSVDLIAAEPRLHQPIAFTFDARGRLWVVEGHSYPVKRPAGEGLDRILVFSDDDADGHFEKRTVFSEGLNLVSGLQVGHGGVWVGAAPELLFIPDRDRDLQPDAPPQVLLDGFGFADTHETINSFVWGPDGWLYGNQGVFNQSHVGKPGTGSSQRVGLAAGVWRYHPTRHQFEVFAHGGSNQWGLDFDDFGQLFMTHCRSAWGRGATTHVVQGAHYWNQVNSGYAPFISAQPIAGLPQMKNYMLASARYGHGEGGAGKRGSRAVYGGHSHVGTMIYLGDNWPAEYRNHLFTHNLHGHQINHQVNLRERGGYNTVHAGYDVFFCEDRQFIGVDLQCGPDGAVYLSDWYDPRLCHSPDPAQWDRGNGRMYRMKYDAAYSPVQVDYAAASDAELVAAQMHASDWHVRQARLVLSERAAAGSISAAAVERLRSLALGHESAARRLRAVWCLHGIGAWDGGLAARLIEDPSEYVRAWTVQLAVESLEAAETAALLAELLQREESLFVRRYLASAAGRAPDELAWQILETLSGQAENETDRDLPLLIWYALAPRMKAELPRVLALADASPISAIRHYVHWYAPQLSDEGREAVAGRLAAADSRQRVQLLGLLSSGLQGMRGLKQPSSWATIAPQLYDARDAETRYAAEMIGAAFGDEALFHRLRQLLAADDSSLKSRQHALAVLAYDHSPAKLPCLLKRIDDAPLTLPVIRQLRQYGDSEVAEALVARLATWEQAEADAAMEVLCSRAAWAHRLLDAIGSGEIDKTRLTAFYARQMSGLGDDKLNQRLRAQWGRLEQTSAEARARMAELVDAYNKAPKWAYNRQAGQQHFQKICATCHADTPGSPRVGPKLDGSGAKGIEYIVENIIDPNAVIGKDFLARNIITVDGLVLSGVILKQTESAITLRTANDTVTIAQDDIDEIIVSEKSFMPEGLLQPLNERQRIELLMYLASLR